MAKHVFVVRQHDPELVRPAAPTPRDTKRLSDIDDRGTLGGHVSFALVYRGRVPGDDVMPDDPAGVVRRALGEALVQYYPLAGRLREVDGSKLVVDCTGQGVLFAEADADVRLDELERGAGLKPPFLLFDVEGSSGVVNCPLLLIQVTRLLCGSFVLGLRLNQTIWDSMGIGIAQFMNTVLELARGLPAPTIRPGWYGQLLQARSRPTTPFPHRECTMIPGPPPDPVDPRNPNQPKPPKQPPPDDMVKGMPNFWGVADLGSNGVPPTALADAATLHDGSNGDAVALVRQAENMPNVLISRL